jgi:hypothetical protein
MEQGFPKVLPANFLLFEFFEGSAEILELTVFRKMRRFYGKTALLPAPAGPRDGRMTRCA